MIIGTVTASSGTTLSVTPDGSVAAVSAVDCAGAQVGDRVVMEYHATQLLAMAIVGGPHGGGVTPADYITERGVSNGWAWRKWSSGRAECRKRVHLYVSSWSDWGSIKESAQVFAGNNYPSGLFASAPAITAELVNTPGAAAYISGFETGPNGTEVRNPDIAVLRPTSAPAGYFDFDVVATLEVFS